MRGFNDKKLGDFGKTYELKVLKQIIGTKEQKGDKYRRDDAFGRKMLRQISQEHFDDNNAKTLITFVKDYFTDKDKVPFYDTLEYIIRDKKNSKETEMELLLSYLEKIQSVDTDDYEYIQNSCRNFINTKNLYNAWASFERDCISQGKYDEYQKYADNMSSVILSNSDEDELEAMVQGDHSDLDENEKLCIPTGIKELDKVMNNGRGLAIGDIALLIAPLKTGKTTVASLFTGNAANLGFSVLQLVFEDSPEQIKLKHRAKFSNESLGFVSNLKNKTTTTKRSDAQLSKINKNGGCIVIHKMDSTNTTVVDIANIIKKARDRGVYFKDTKEYKKITFDLVLIDYVDCIIPKVKNSDDWKGDKEILRDLEKLCSPKYGLGFACWCFTQGNQDSIEAKLVTTKGMSGSIRKAQIVHFLCSIGRTLEQRSKKEATFAILGSRLGDDGLIFNSCHFDNSRVTMELTKEGNISEITTNDALLK